MVIRLSLQAQTTFHKDGPYFAAKIGPGVHFYPGVIVYFIPRIFYPGDNIYYPTDSISLVYFIPRQDILSLHGDKGMSRNISVATQSKVQHSVSTC